MYRFINFERKESSIIEDNVSFSESRKIIRYDNLKQKIKRELKELVCYLQSVICIQIRLWTAQQKQLR